MSEPASKKARTDNHAGINLNFALDKEHETKSLKEIVDLPVSALQGLAERADDIMSEFRVGSIRQLGTWRFALYAAAILELSEVEEEDGRHATAHMNIHAALDKADQHKSLRELVQSPVSVFHGISDAGAEILSKLNVRTVGDLGKWKFFRWSRAMVVLAEKEKDKPTAELSSELKALSEPSIHNPK
eukprot:c16051_g1_i1.p1 GENE.c16051_g1_i1~~c16051_g1_i1.p1  ORF type:complete len:187 (+),score=54.91 c16051_g1_i1:39-599(+)